MYSFSHWGLELLSYWRAFTRMFYPALCLLCQKNLEIDEKGLCSACLMTLPKLKKPLCSKCSMEIPPFAPSRSSRCPSCRNVKTYFNRGVSIFSYGETMKTLLHAVKFEKKPWYLKSLKTFLEQTRLPLPVEEYDLVVPVPLDPSRKGRREFNQSELIARLLLLKSKASKPANVLKKVKKTAPQSSLDRKERLRNLEGAFRIRRRAPLKGKKVLLVDDIVTTTSTINECAKCFREAGALRIDFFSLVRTVA